MLELPREFCFESFASGLLLLLLALSWERVCCTSYSFDQTYCCQCLRKYCWCFVGQLLLAEVESLVEKRLVWVLTVMLLTAVCLPLLVADPN
jgi:hypothetical protein